MYILIPGHMNSILAYIVSTKLVRGQWSLKFKDIIPHIMATKITQTDSTVCTYSVHRIAGLLSPQHLQHSAQ